MDLRITLSEPTRAIAEWAWLGDVAKVLLGAGIAFGTTWWFAHRTERARRLALAFSLVFRFGEAAQYIVGTQRLFTRELKRADSEKYPYKWMLVQVPVGFDWRDSVVFTPEEQTLLASKGEASLVSRLGELARIHNILVMSASEYAKRREALTAKMAQELVVLSGTEMTAAISPEALEQLQPDMAIVENLLEQLLALMSDGATLASKLAEEIPATLRRVLKDKRLNVVVSIADP